MEKMQEMWEGKNNYKNIDHCDSLKEWIREKIQRKEMLCFSGYCH